MLELIKKQKVYVVTSSSSNLGKEKAGLKKNCQPVLLVSFF